MKRTAILICLAAAAALLLTGCAPQEAGNQASGASASLSALQYEIENIAVDFSSMWYFRKIEEQTGVHVDFNEVRDSEWSSSVNLAFAKGKMPDLILRGSLDIEEYGVTDDSWNEFLAKAQAIGSERYIELYQNAYDAYLAK